MTRRSLVLLSIAGFAVGLGGCTLVSPVKMSGATEPVRTASSPAAFEHLHENAERLLAASQPDEAVRSLQNGSDRVTRETRLADLLVRSLKATVKTADAAFGERRYADAGPLYRTALDAWPESDRLRRELDIDPDRLRERINTCAGGLLESGLLAYRQGRLQEALDVWALINGFHPEYKESQQAISTTRKQLRNLETYRDGPG